MIDRSDGTKQPKPALPSLPPLWPSRRVELGRASTPGDAAETKRRAPYGFRYQYLAGGVNTNQGWQTWGPGFVSSYIDESRACGITPVLVCYQMAQSLPAQSEGTAGWAQNLANSETMAAYYDDLATAFQQARPQVVVIAAPEETT